MGRRMSFNSKNHLDLALCTWFLIIDSKAYEYQINCQNITEFVENPENGMLKLTYFIPVEPKEGASQASKGTGFQMKTGSYDCCENELILKTFAGIQK
mmetsp:Transcript_657/g.1239  ORF Transcript_657/g.1239 Transcript_657/m.1239 type:complete len:98 (+) Transcript_657:690-983(+)